MLSWPISPVLGMVMSFLEHVEWHLRVLALLIGLAVGILSAVAMIRRLRHT